MKNIFVVGLFLLLSLAACTPYMYGVPQESWDRMSEPERIEAMRVYERNEQSRRQAAEERARTRAIEEQTRRQVAEERIRHEVWEREQAQAHQAALERERRDRIEAIHRGEGAYGKLIRVRLQGGLIRIGDRLQRYKPLIFTIADGETRRIDVADNRGTAADLTVSYADGTLSLEGAHFSYEKNWGRGRTYANIGTSRGPELRGAELFIEVQKRSTRFEREAPHLEIIHEPEATPVIRERKHPVATVSSAPFISGKTLRWESDAQGGQNGTIYVTSSNGSSFFLEQKNFKNRAAGIIKLEGTIKDGKVSVYNSKWNETWIGTVHNGIVHGNINNKYNFRISE
ncbi:MAG: hypothetical protein HXX11_17280 [Desulfuromonadales bacterium]|nr:hypothetical protein [Desulfuromonadales bacterium]